MSLWLEDIFALAGTATFVIGAWVLVLETAAVTGWGGLQ